MTAPRPISGLASGSKLILASADCGLPLRPFLSLSLDERRDLYLVIESPTGWEINTAA